MTRQSYTNLFQAGMDQSEYTISFLQHFQSWLLADDQRKQLHFFYSIFRSARYELVSVLSENQLQEYFTPYMVEALLDSKTKRLALEFLTATVIRQPKKLALLMLNLLYHNHYAVSERAKMWLKDGMKTTNKQHYAQLFEEMMEQKGRITQ